MLVQGPKFWNTVFYCWKICHDPYINLLVISLVHQLSLTESADLQGFHSKTTAAVLAFVEFEIAVEP